MVLQDKRRAGDFEHGPHWGIRYRKNPFMLFLLGAFSLAGLIGTGAFSSTFTLKPGADSPTFSRWTDEFSGLQRHWDAPGHRGPLFTYSFQPWGGVNPESLDRDQTDRTLAGTAVFQGKLQSSVQKQPGVYRVTNELRDGIKRGRLEEKVFIKCTMPEIPQDLQGICIPLAHDIFMGGPF